ncbi:MAG: RagB/SusD family nutrient uptake outer membrane protein [Bacteroidales bacterium]|nr:RagB/SusD family nutrient uptake outer membrane protein [Bacteroidales bacterium]
MKKIILLAATLLLSVSFTSCTDRLENPQKGVIDLETYYKNAGPAECEQLIAAAYNSFFDMLSVGSGNTLDILGGDMTNGGGSWSDNANAYRDGQELILTLGSWPFSSERRGAKMFESFYNLIYRCNLIVDNVPDQAGEVARIKGEAKAMRALGLWEAMKWYGTPPFADHIYSDEDMYAPNGDPAEMITWILQNLDEASNALPALPGKGQQAKIGGRFTAEAAKAYYGKVAVWYGTKYKDNAILQKGQAALKAVINSGKYDLIPVEDLFYYRADFCPEYILERNAAEVSVNQMMQNDNRHTWRGLRFDRIQVPAGVINYSWGYCLPSKDFVEFMLAHDGGEDNPRLRSKIISYDRLLTLPYAPGTTPGVFEGNTLVDCVGWFNYLGFMWESEEYSDTGSDHMSRANDPKLRYADVLLLYAEACVALNSEMADGLAALNKVRVRAGLEPLASMTYQDVKDERRAEMWGERDRYFDLVRWGDVAQARKDAGKVRYEFYGYKPGTTEYDIRESAGLGHGWDDKFLLFPFPDLQLKANPNLKQNPGW